jgi:hypothetical protein
MALGLPSQEGDQLFVSFFDQKHLPAATGIIPDAGHRRVRTDMGKSARMFQSRSTSLL